MVTHFKHWLQTLLYFIVESSITAIFVSIVWEFFLKKYFNVEILYIDFIAGIFVIKITISHMFSTVLELDKNAENKN